MATANTENQAAGAPEAATPAATNAADASEYIDDRAIETSREDRLGHEAIVEELAHLIESQDQQTNVALFAPWGSGKTGISRLLRQRIEGSKSGDRYVYFDAFKHRDTSLRRSFIRRVADELGKSPDEVDRLSAEEVTQTLDRRSWPELLLFVLTALAIGILLMAVVALPLAGIRPEKPGQDFWTSFGLIFTDLSGIATLVAALVGVLVAGLVGGVTITRRRTPLSEDDEFEDAFVQLAKGSSRLVVFVDELDRCGADEVVETLETMRVFLGVANCVFVVAADRQAIEQALRKKARQETPRNEAHPYFSSASAYVDKIFQFQITLPPLRWTDMGWFAETLVSSRPGLWEQLRDRGELQGVLAALVPTHVTSPRRVKVLLNAFVTEYRLASRRVEEGDLAPITGRGAALAQLVCLRAEFPLYAAELERYPELNEAMLGLAGVTDVKQVRKRAPQAVGRATGFMEGGEPLAPLLYEEAPGRAAEEGARVASDESPPAEQEDPE